MNRPFLQTLERGLRVTDEGNNSDEPAEALDALEDVYGAADMQTILGTVRWRSDVPRDQIARQVDRAAWWYKPARRLLKEDRRPSERERRLKSVLGRLHAAAAAVQGLSPNDLDHLKSAGQALAKAEKGLPDIEPEPVELPRRPGQAEAEFMHIWDAAGQIDASLERLDWLMRCVKRAVERTNWEILPHGGAVADDPLHTVIRLLDKVYFEYAAEPRGPGTDIGDDSKDSRTWRKSELLDFLEAALFPLDIEKNREAIYGDWRRATEPDD